MQQPLPRRGAIGRRATHGEEPPAVAGPHRVFTAVSSRSILTVHASNTPQFGTFGCTLPDVRQS
jgi:hypothetical protein